MFNSFKKIVPVLLTLAFPLVVSAQTCLENCTVKVKHFKEELTFKQYGFGLDQGDLFCANSCESQILTHTSGNLVIHIGAGKNFCIKGSLENATLVQANWEGVPSACYRYGRSKGESMVKLLGKELRIHSMIYVDEATGNLSYTYLHGTLFLKMKSGQEIGCERLNLERDGYIDGRGCDNKEWIKISEIDSLTQEPLVEDSAGR